MHFVRMPQARLAIATAMTFMMLVVRVAHAAYVQADLAGTWRSQTLASGPGEPWWERGQVTITPVGGLTVYATDHLGQLDTTYATVVLGPDGVVTLPGMPSFRAALDLGRTVLIGTDAWSGGSEAGTTELKIAVRTPGGYQSSDLAGQWEFNSIASGASAPWWIRGRQTIDANGQFAGTFTENTGDTSPVSGNLAVLPDGSVTISVAPDARGWLDAGRTLLVMTNTWSDGSTELITGVRMAPSYTPADLAGTWEMHSLATGPGAPWWNRGRVTIGADGTFAGTLSDHTGSSDPVSGTFTMGANGVMTRNGSSVARGVLDVGRSVMVWTDTWDSGSPGTSEMVIGVRTDGSVAGVPESPVNALLLDRVRPNPTRGSAFTVRFSLPDASAARLELLDVTGRALATRNVGALGAGTHAVTLAPRERVRPGLYFVRLRQGTQERVVRVTVVE